jgi:hypothetical protein
MSEQAEIIRVAIASPSDLHVEREAIPKLFDRWNTGHEDQNILIRPIMWETSSIPELGDHPQHILDRQIIERADLLVAIFWTKIGSPTPTAASGTIEEIREFVQRKGAGRAMVYFCTRQVSQSPDDIDTSALDAIKKFKVEMRSQGLYRDFRETAELERDLYFHLDAKVKQLRKGQLPIPGAAPYNDDVWWDVNAADDRLRAPLELGFSIMDIASRFALRMDDFEKEGGATNNRFLKLGEHVYRSVARAIDIELHSRPQEIDFRVQPKLNEVSRQLRLLGTDLDQYLRGSAPEFWANGRLISNRLTELAKENEEFIRKRSL